MEKNQSKQITTREATEELLEMFAEHENTDFSNLTIDEGVLYIEQLKQSMDKIINKTKPKHVYIIEENGEPIEISEPLKFSEIPSRFWEYDETMLKEMRADKNATSMIFEYGNTEYEANISEAKTLPNKKWMSNHEKDKKYLKT